MKKKSLVMLAVSGVLATSMFYTIPAIADDTIDANSDEPLQILADNGMQNDTTQNTSPTNTSPTTNTSPNTSPTADSNTQQSQQLPNGNDAGSPDTATGDDDY